MLLLIGAFVFNRFLAVSRVPAIASEWIVGLGISRYIVLIIVLILYIILGMFFDITAMLILTVPIFFPTMVALHFDPVWYGVLMCRVSEMGFISPPFGLKPVRTGGGNRCTLIQDVPGSDSLLNSRPGALIFINSFSCDLGIYTQSYEVKS